MSWTSRWKRACAGGIAPGMHLAEIRCGGGFASNFCITTVGNDGIITKYGFIEGQFGVAGPTETADGTPLYEWTWDALGNFIISFGPTGTTQLTDVDSIVIHTMGYDSHVAIWDGTAYLFRELDIATELIANSPSKVCMSMGILPSLFIHYTYSELLRGV